MEPQDENTSNNLDPDKLIKNLVNDPSKVPNLKMLSGYLGNSNQDKFWRLYLTPELNEFIEIPEEEVVHYKRLEDDQSPLGGTILWVKNDTTLRYTRAESSDVQAKFLEGEITSSFLSGVSMGSNIGLGAFGRFYLRKTFNVTQCATCPATGGPETECASAFCTWNHTCPVKGLY